PSARAKDRRTPFDFEVGVKMVTRRPTALEPADSLITTAHKPGESLCLGSQATAHGRSRRFVLYKILHFVALRYDAMSVCLVPGIAGNETRKVLLAAVGADVFSAALVSTNPEPLAGLARPRLFPFAQAAPDFRLQVSPEIFRHDPRRRQLLQVG